jgi:thymidylate synthase
MEGIVHIHTRNVNSAFREIVYGLQKGLLPAERSSSRNGEVLVIEEPVTVTYEKPRERVLLNAVRDANPFLHLYEGLWQLAGQCNVAPLEYYNSRMSEYSDDGVLLNDAYGYRWRHAVVIDEYNREPPSKIAVNKEVDQLAVLCEHMQRFPDTRRAVLQMWNVQDDLGHVNYGKAVCCNLSIVFRIMVDGLHMTVFNRSNDLTWGMLGADYVHFTLLQEYMARRLNVCVGKYHQVSNNLHVYISRWYPDAWLADYTAVRARPSVMALVNDWQIFDLECREFVELNSNGGLSHGHLRRWSEPFLNVVAQPMMNAFHAHKVRDYRASMAWVDRVDAADWRQAAELWMLKRINSWQRRSHG